MRWKFKIKDCFIIVFSVFLILSYIYIEKSKVLVEDEDYTIKYQASERMVEALEEIKNEKIRRGIEIDLSSDINATGIIGLEFNGITTTLGSVESKRTSANPNFTAVLIDLLKETGVKDGDYVAINFSSSFPGLNIATLIACEALGLNPVIITSIGSSTWGGNNLNFTYADMENHLYNKGLIRSQSIAISPGGAKDIGEDMIQEDLNIIINRMRSYGKKIIIEENLSRNVEYRYNLYYENYTDISAFINVGGNIVSFGNTTDSLKTPIGYVKDVDYTISDKSGLLQKFYKANVPVIHLLNIQELSNRYEMKVDSPKPYEIGEGSVYYTYIYDYKLIVVVLISSLVLLITYRSRLKS